MPHLCPLCDVALCRYSDSDVRCKSLSVRNLHVLHVQTMTIRWCRAFVSYIGLISQASFF